MAVLPPVHALPEELLILIFGCLDSAAPSELKSRQEPDLSLTSGDSHPLKDISCVSRKWRRIVQPVLFRYARVRLDVPQRVQWSQCRICGKDAGTTSRELQQPTASVFDGSSYHAAIVREARNRLDTTKTKLETDRIAESLQCASRLHHCIRDFLQFVQDNVLAHHIHSLVVQTSHMYSDYVSRFPHDKAMYEDYRWEAAAGLWQQVFALMNPERIVILAPPADLAWLTNCAIDLLGDWAFSDMNFHSLELRYDGPRVPAIFRQPLDATDLKYLPRKFPSVADSSVINLRPFTHLGLNEGSFLRAYATYEFLERGPPSLIYSVKNAISHNLKGSGGSGALHAVRSFQYTAIFPFATHLDFRDILPQLDELDVQLAPDPNAGILTNSDRIGKADLGDCWQEFFTGYRLITRPFYTFKIKADGTPRLKKFSCRDVQIPLIKDDLDEEFESLQLPVWAELKPGEFVRLCDRPISDTEPEDLI